LKKELKNEKERLHRKWRCRRRWLKRSEKDALFIIERKKTNADACIQGKGVLEIPVNLG